MKLSDAKNSAESSGTQKIHEFRKTAKRGILAATGIVVLVALLFMTGSWKSEKTSASKQPPVQNAARSSATDTPSPSGWTKLTVPAGGRSETVPIPPGMRMTAKGNGFVLHIVYADGTECTTNSGPCPSKPMVGAYMTNKGKEPTIVSYSFSP